MYSSEFWSENSLFLCTRHKKFELTSNSDMLAEQSIRIRPSVKLESREWSDSLNTTHSYKLCALDYLQNEWHIANVRDAAVQQRM